jgi:hypothetical protein
MASDNLTPERALEMLAADGQTVTDFTDAILAAWTADASAKEEAERLLDALVGCGNATFGVAWADGVAMLMHLANAHRNALADSTAPKAVELSTLRARLATVTAWVDALVPLVPIVDAFVEDGCQRSQWFGTVELTQIATARHHHAAIRAERATTEARERREDTDNA